MNSIKSAAVSRCATGSRALSLFAGGLEFDTWVDCDRRGGADGDWDCAKLEPPFDMPPGRPLRLADFILGSSGPVDRMNSANSLRDSSSVVGSRAASTLVRFLGAWNPCFLEIGDPTSLRFAVELDVLSEKPRSLNGRSGTSSVSPRTAFHRGESGF
jgi:hypothetical protein